MSNADKAIGIFDSGLGGISVLNEIKEMLPSEDFIYFGDSLHAPYGVKSREEITARCHTICEFFLHKGVKAIVIACNTATSACVNELRMAYPMLTIIGMEPALKVAAEKEGKQHILVLATDFTLKERKFAELMKRCEADHVIYKQACPKLVEIVEQHELKNKDTAMEVLKEYLKPYDLMELDSIVLGCTHFVFYREYLNELLPSHIEIIDGNHGTSRHLMHKLKERGELQSKDHEGTLQIYNSLRDDEDIQELSEELLKG